MSRKKTVKRRKKFRYVLALTILFLALLGVLLGFQNGIFDNLSKLSHEPELYVVEGECYVIGGNLFYQVDDEGDCVNECNNECWVRNKELKDAEFIKTDKGCNSCNCYCN